MTARCSSASSTAASTRTTRTSPPNIDVADSVNCTDAGTVDRTAGAWAPTTSDHGTHVAGTIAAARNGVGIVGVAPGVRMAAVKVVNDDGFIYPEYAICGFVWAGMQKMDVTNNSYYIDPMMYWCDDQPDQAAVLEAVGRAVEWSTDQGVVHAAAAGNAATDLSNNTTDTTSPNDTTPITRDDQRGLHRHPDRVPGCRDGVGDDPHRAAGVVQQPRPAASSTSRPRAGPSCRPSWPTTATAPRAARRWRRRTSRACWRS